VRSYSKFWTAAVLACMAGLVIAALVLPRTFALTAFSDWIQCFLLLSGTLAFVPIVLRSHGRLRLFWALLALGTAFWFSYQVVWTYYEVWLRQDVPELCAADIVLFLHIVPMMAALALRPHAPQAEYSSRLRNLDFALMMFWWIYLYVFAVMSWQYVVADIDAYNTNLNLLYLIEKLAFLGTLFVFFLKSTGDWKILYGNLFGASMTYATASYFANWAIGRNVYYSGSFYDVPLVASMAWITLIGLWSQRHQLQPATGVSSTLHGVWLARLGMVTVFSLPLFAAFAMSETSIAPRVRSFRLLLTLSAALWMGVMVFVRQRLLDRELFRLLNQSRESLANLKRLQAQITESEKLASIVQFVGGAAHELNNPITAMLGYSDLLMSTSLSPEQQGLAEKIGQHVRRTRALVASLLSFAKQGPAAMAPVDLRTVLRTAIKLSEPVWQALKIEVRTDLQPNLPSVMGDSNQLLQVCVQILNNALHAADHSGSRILNVSLDHKNGAAIILVSDHDFALVPNSVVESEHTMPESAPGQPLSGMGLSACKGILQQHHGTISWQQGNTVGITIRVELPVIYPAAGKSTAIVVPARWQSQPFA
jgi:signal transduction histidine kinase